MTGLLRQSVYSRLGGYEDTNGAEGLRKDPGIRAVIGERALERAGAGETTIGRFEKEILRDGNNLCKMDELFIMAYNLGNMFRTLALPDGINEWPLRTIQLKLIKTGGRLIQHAR